DVYKIQDKKWQVFFLSEHNEQMDQQQESSRLKWREAMSSECIESVLVLLSLTRLCLLYTSDAADELDGVDLGGLRIIKKKKKP
ncbi:hypothetical protein LKL54_15730, partial [Listeria monocytogenes ATCC 19115]|nr:hypothetical protein [Listeria monocytogenes ATCC 19115]